MSEGAVRFGFSGKEQSQTILDAELLVCILVEVSAKRLRDRGVVKNITKSGCFVLVCSWLFSAL